MEGHKLYIALRLMNKGSAADVMRYGWPGGMEEDVVGCILRQALKGLKFVISLTIPPFDVNSCFYFAATFISTVSFTEMSKQQISLLMTTERSSLVIWG
jgi:serine/threonine protein kinase